jgi:hypothetical protein
MTISRQDCTIGFFVSFGYTKDAEREITYFWNGEQRVIVPPTVQEVLDGNFGRNLV